jgi:zinc-binding in reverse transcriptase
MENQDTIQNQIFMWLVRKNRILTKTNLVRRGWQCDTHCVFYSGEKIVITFLFNVMLLIVCGNGYTKTVCLTRQKKERRKWRAYMEGKIQ